MNASSCKGLAFELMHFTRLDDYPLVVMLSFVRKWFQGVCPTTWLSLRVQRGCAKTHPKSSILDLTACTPSRKKPSTPVDLLVNLLRPSVFQVFMGFRSNTA